MTGEPGASPDSTTAPTIEVAETGPAAAADRGPRRVLAALFWLLASISVMLSGLAVWTHQALLTADGYGAIVEDVIDDPEVLENLSTVLVTRLSDRLGVQDRVADVLPGSLDIVAGALTAGVEDRVIGLVEDFLAREGFQDAFVEVNKAGHDAAMAAIRGSEGEALTSENGLITLNIFPLIQSVLVVAQDAGLISADREIPDLSGYEPSDRAVALLERVVGRDLPDDIGTIVLVDSENLELVQTVVRWFDLITIALVALTLLFIALALWLAERRVRMVMWLAFGAIAALATTRLVARFIFGGISRRAQEGDAGVVVLAILDAALASLLVFMLAAMVVALLIAIVAMWWERRAGERPSMTTPPRTLAGWLRDNARLALVAGLAVIGFVVLWSVGGPDLALGTAAVVGLLAIAYVVLTGHDEEAPESEPDPGAGG